MQDPLTPEQRSKLMSKVRGSGNKGTELRLMEIFRTNGITGWRRGSRLPGKPDFVFLRVKVAIFVDGCFWHGCRWHCRMPKSRTEFWLPKIEKNRRRDREVSKLLRAVGWRCLRIWEHSLAEPELVLRKVKDALEISGNKHAKH